tara:strand:+ start:438 stop:644 length:207 start_codon:yes stop_codon:yes gene_type:complete
MNITIFLLLILNIFTINELYVETHKQPVRTFEVKLIDRHGIAHVRTATRSNDGVRVYMAGVNTTRGTK